MPLNNLISRARFARAYYSCIIVKLVFWLLSEAAFYFVRMENKAMRLLSINFLARNVVKQISQNVNREACPYTSKKYMVAKKRLYFLPLRISPLV